MPEIVYPPILLEQVFQNLIVNGIRHFGKKKGKVVVSCISQEKFWCFRVWDNGQGIKKQHFDRIFESGITNFSNFEIEAKHKEVAVNHFYDFINLEERMAGEVLTHKSFPN